MKLKSIFSSILAVALLVGLTTSCEDELQTQKQDVVKIMKTEITGPINVLCPDEVMHDTDFDIVISAACGHLTLQQGYIMVEDEMVFKGLDCETADLLWMDVEGVEVDDCGNGTFTQNISEYGVYVYQVVLDPSALIDDSDPENPVVLCEACDPVSEVLVECFQVIVCRTETAFGGDVDPMVEKGAWFFVFDTGDWDEVENPELVQNITADSDVVIGTVTYDGVGFTLEFTPDWMLLVGEEESVKVGGFADVPDKRPSGGKLGLYKGTVIEDAVLDGSRYYVIHLDVQTCNPLNFVDPI